MLLYDQPETMRLQLMHCDLFAVHVLQNPPLPSDLKGRNFVKVLGTHTRYHQKIWIHRHYCQWLQTCRFPRLILEFILYRQSTLIAGHVLAVYGCESLSFSYVHLDIGGLYKMNCLVLVAFSALELLLIKKRIKGPSWLSIARPQRVESSSQVSLVMCVYLLACNLQLY